MARAMPATVSTIVDTVNRAGRGVAMAAPFTAPATVFNADVTADRSIALAQLDFDDVNRVRNRFEVKVNDVVLALCAGALREFLRNRGELPDKPLVAVVPMSVHGKCDRPGAQSDVGVLLQPADAHRGSGRPSAGDCRSEFRAKEHSSAIGPTLVHDVAEVATRAVFGFVLGLAARPISRIDCASRVIRPFVPVGDQLPVHLYDSEKERRADAEQQHTVHRF
jgi:diacylglycerol O-acyltransferase